MSPNARVLTMLILMVSLTPGFLIASMWGEGQTFYQSKHGCLLTNKIQKEKSLKPSILNAVDFIPSSSFTTRSHNGNLKTHRLSCLPKESHHVETLPRPPCPVLSAPSLLLTLLLLHSLPHLPPDFTEEFKLPIPNLEE